MIPNVSTARGAVTCGDPLPQLLAKTHSYHLNVVGKQSFGTIVFHCVDKKHSQNIFSYFPQKKVTLFSNDFKISKVMTEL